MAEDIPEFDDYPREEPRARDPAVDLALRRLRLFFNDSPERLFYSTQIETTLEADFFHWITGKALLELGNAKEIRRISESVQGQPIVNFYANRKHRYLQRQLNAMLALLNRIYDPEFKHAIGRQGELMFDAALGRAGFKAEAINTKTWAGKTWQETNHDLDRILTRDGIAYGVEIKNTQNYIPHQELQIKLQLCKALSLTPVFIMRFAPKSYMWEIYQQGGFGLLFEKQLYPWGHSALLEQVQRLLGLKVHSPRDVEQGHIQRFPQVPQKPTTHLRHSYSEYTRYVVEYQCLNLFAA